MRFNLKVSLLALSIGLASASSFAANFAVNPLKVVLSPQKNSEILSIHNSANLPLRLQIEAKNWSVGANGEWVLTDTDDLIYTPELLEIGPGQDAVLRVGSDNPPDEKEQSYRLLMTEIPDASTATTTKNGVELKVRTQLSLPVFIEPPVPVQPELHITNVQQKNADMRISIINKGTQRTDAQGVSVNVLDASGKSIDKQQETISYALSNSSVNLDLKVKPETCAVSDSVQVTFTSPVETLTQKISADNKKCGPKTS